ncbi:MAG TPA: hypothetical protein VKB39_05015, partial [Candidatus Baltobacteraceae bacterium]|nr:hypothetical protein [Candidatus Baltobacteraceae bacterium]
MNLTMAALDRWLANIAPADDGEEVGKQIGAMYREIRLVVEEVSGELPGDDEEEDDDEDEDDDDEVIEAEIVDAERRVAVFS